MDRPPAGWAALSVRELKAELWERRGISYGSCVEKCDLIALLEASERHRARTPPRTRPEAGPSEPPPGPPTPAPPLAPLSRATLLTVLQSSLQLSRIAVEYVNHAGHALALTDAAVPRSLQDVPQWALELYTASRTHAYRAAAALGAAAQLLALPAAERVGSDASTALLAYRCSSPEQHGSPLFAKFRVDVHAFDERFDVDFSKPAFTYGGYNDGVHLRGGLRYHRPLGWVRFALNVDRFETSAWLGSMGQQGEWAVAYHGTSSDAVAPIVKNGLRQPRSQDEKQHGAFHGEGVYLTPHAEVAAEFAPPVQIDNGDGVRYFQVVFQCRVRPGAYTCHRDPLYGDIFVVRSEADVRPYGMLLGECLANGVPSQAWGWESSRIAARGLPRAAPAGKFWDEFSEL